MSALIPNEPQTLLFAADRRARILSKTRLSSMDSMISNPTEEELDAAILDAIDSLNLIQPITSYYITDVANEVAAGNVNLNYLVLIGACYQIMWTIWDDWAHSGDSIELSILREPDRMDRFQTIMNSFKEEFERLAKDFKMSGSVRLSKASFSSTSRSIGYSSGRGNRRNFKSAYRSC